MAFYKIGDRKWENKNYETLVSPPKIIFLTFFFKDGVVTPKKMEWKPVLPQNIKNASEKNIVLSIHHNSLKSSSNYKTHSPTCNAITVSQYCFCNMRADRMSSSSIFEMERHINSCMHIFYDWIRLSSIHFFTKVANENQSSQVH